MSAIELLEKAAGHLKDRAATHDKPEGERSIGATVAAFNAITGDGIMNTGERGWLFMAILKMVRSQQGNYRADNYEDLAAYSSLMGEAACDERNGGWTPGAIEAAAFRKSCGSADVECSDDAINESSFKDAYKEYTLQEVIGDAVLSDWARWVAVDEDGGVGEYSEKPSVNYIQTEWITHTGYFTHITNAVPPFNFKNCIFEVKR